MARYWRQRRMRYAITSRYHTVCALMLRYRLRATLLITARNIAARRRRVVGEHGYVIAVTAVEALRYC